MISIVVPTRNNSQHLEACLKSLSKQDHKHFEMIVVFDSSLDKNTTIAKKYGAKVVFDTNHTIGGAYHTGVKMAKGEIVAFVDDDCTVPAGWLKKIEKEFNEDIDVVSGEDILPKNSTCFQNAVYQIDKARTLKKPLYGKDACKRLRAANIAYRKKVFSRENFNTKLTGLQEPEFHERLFEKGFRMKFNPEVFVYHHRRNSSKDIFMQIYRNGKAKIDLLKIHKNMISVIDIIPFILIIYTLAMIYLSYHVGKIMVLVWFLSILAYFLIKPLMILAKTHEFRYYFYLVGIVFVRETAYFLGILAGLPRIFKR